jgi:hypothetical protein
LQEPGAGKSRKKAVCGNEEKNVEKRRGRNGKYEVNLLSSKSQLVKPDEPELERRKRRLTPVLTKTSIKLNLKSKHSLSKKRIRREDSFS